MSLLKSITNINRRYLFVLIIILVSYPLLRPFPLVVPVSKYTQDYYDVIESLEPGSLVVVGTQVASRDNEIYPQMIATLNQLKSKQAKIITYCPVPGAEQGTEWILEETGYDQLVYGTDYVHLGFFSGDDATLAAFSADMVGTKEVDHYGQQTSTMPIFENVNTMDDVDLVITISGGNPGFDLWARNVIIPYNTPALIGVAGSTVSGVFDYIKLGVFQGGVIAQKGTVEYESLIGKAGRATGTYAPAYLQVLVLVILMIFNNLVIGFERLTGRRT